MTQVKFRVKEIQIILTDWKARKNGDSNNKPLYTPQKLPVTMAYTKSWIFRFECGACHERIDFDKTTQRSRTVLDCLFEPYYPKEILQTIASFFENMKVFSNSEEPDKLFLTHQGYNDINSATLLIPKIRLHYNSCPSCNTPTLYWLNDEPPRAPCREYHMGGPGFLQINEIIGIDGDENDEFFKLLN